MSNDDTWLKTLIILLIIAFCFIIIFVIILAIIIIKEKKDAKILKERMKNRQAGRNGEQENDVQVTKAQVLYSPESILDFMDFEKIEDNMIIQKKGKYLMVVECKGINYDLMDEMEKISVEQGFTSFLNTLKYPIQIYIQTRTINLEKSIVEYSERLKEIENLKNSLYTKYENLLKNKNSSKKEIEQVKYELVKQRNLAEYTEDVIKDVKRQSLNKNILGKKYYIIIPCYSFEIVTGEYDKNEIKNMAFSELYTRARAIINALFTCQVVGKVLNSEELTELLYVAYNRDESDLFWLEKMKKAGFDELYSTAPDAIDKKMKLLNKQIEEKAITLANEKISEARRDREMELIEKETNEEEFINKRARELIEKHRKYIGKEIANSAKIKLESESTTKMQNGENKEENANDVVQEERKRGRKRKE